MKSAINLLILLSATVALAEPPEAIQRITLDERVVVAVPVSTNRVTTTEAIIERMFSLRLVNQIVRDMLCPISESDFHSMSVGACRNRPLCLKTQRDSEIARRSP